MAGIMNGDYQGKELFVLNVLDGAFMVWSDVVKNLEL